MRKKKETEYHTGRLNISCPPSVKDAIAADATARDQSISQFITELYEKSTQAGSSEHLARMGLELVGLKKRLQDVDTHLRRALARGQGAAGQAVAQELARLHELQSEVDGVLTETVEAVRALKTRGL